MDPIIEKGKDRMIVAASQTASMLTGSLLSAYWAAVEGQPIPMNFIHQARDNMAQIETLLRRIELKGGDA